MLKRTRYLLTQNKEKWNDYQQEMMKNLFEKFDDIKTAYQLQEDFKTWYDKGNAYKPRLVIETELYQWYSKVDKSNLNEFKSVVKMIQHHEERIINFFSKQVTNAKAERINGKIQRFISQNYGFKDKDFSLYRLSKYFS